MIVDDFIETWLYNNMQQDKDSLSVVKVAVVKTYRLVLSLISATESVSQISVCELNIDD
jgi:hypothetical protein